MSPPNTPEQAERTMAPTLAAIAVEALAAALHEDAQGHPTWGDTDMPSASAAGSDLHVLGDEYPWILTGLDACYTKRTRDALQLAEKDARICELQAALKTGQERNQALAARLIALEHVSRTAGGVEYGVATVVARTRRAARILSEAAAVLERAGQDACVPDDATGAGAGPISPADANLLATLLAEASCNAAATTADLSAPGTPLAGEDAATEDGILAWAQGVLYNAKPATQAALTRLFALAERYHEPRPQGAADGAGSPSAARTEPTP